jgi:hypothetical protein
LIVRDPFLALKEEQEFRTKVFAFKLIGYGINTRKLSSIEFKYLNISRNFDTAVRHEPLSQKTRLAAI